MTISHLGYNLKFVLKNKMNNERMEIYCWHIMPCFEILKYDRFSLWY